MSNHHPQIEWPSKPTLPETLRSEITDIYTEIHGTEHTPPLRGQDGQNGGGRVVYDISPYIDGYFVVKIPHNEYGHIELANELTHRDRLNPDLQNRLPPVYARDSKNWGIQPLCDISIPPTDIHTAAAELRSIFDDSQFDQREISNPNIGLYQDQYVLVDYGGIFK